MRSLGPTVPNMLRSLCTSTFFGVSLCASVASLGCTATSEEVAPPRHDFYYPTSIVPSADGRHLFVLNANSDLRYDSGTIQALDLEAVEPLLAGSNPGCDVGYQPSRPNLAMCTTSTDGTPSPFVVEAAHVKTGNFGSALAAQAIDGGRTRLFATVRGDPSITYADFDPTSGALDCGGEGEFQRCGDTHRVDTVLDDPEIGGLSPEPFQVVVDAGAEHAFVTHLTTGRVSLLTAPADGARPILQDVIAGLFDSNPNGLVRAVGLAVRTSGELVYVTSSSEARVASVYVADGPIVNGLQTERLIEGPSFFIGDARPEGIPGDSRSIAFEPGGERVFVVGRTPPALLAFDTAAGPTGAPANAYLGAVEVCGNAAALGLGDMGAGLRAWIPCFNLGQVWVVDVEHARLEAVIEAGRGPNAIVVDTPRQRIYVANYAEDTISIIDAQPGSRTEHAELVRLGLPRDVEDRQ